MITNESELRKKYGSLYIPTNSNDVSINVNGRNITFVDSQGNPVNGLNDNMKVKILNYIDRNGDGTIDYKEFINFINNYPDDDDEDFVNEEFSEVGDKNNFDEQSSHEPFEKNPNEEENREEEEINTKLKVPKKIKEEKEEEENEEEQENEENENKEEEEENEEKEEENEEKEEEENLLISLKTIKENYNFNKTQMNSKLVPNLDKKLTDGPPRGHTSILINDKLYIFGGTILLGNLLIICI